MTIMRLLIFSSLIGLAMAAQLMADDYYVYRTSKGDLVISNKEPPQGSTIIKQLPGETEISQAQEPGKTPLTAQPEAAPKPSKNK